MENWIWLGIGITVGVFVTAAFSIILRRNSSSSLDQSNVATQSKIANLERKATGLQARLSVMEAETAEKLRQTEEENRRKLERAKTAHDIEVQELENQLASQNALLFGKYIDTAVEETEVISKPASSGKSYDGGESVDLARLRDLASLAAIAESQLLSEPDDGEEHMPSGLYKSLADKMREESDNEDYSYGNKVSSPTRQTSTRRDNPLALVDAALTDEVAPPELDIVSEVVSDGNSWLELVEFDDTLATKPLVAPTNVIPRDEQNLDGADPADITKLEKSGAKTEQIQVERSPVKQNAVSSQPPVAGAAGQSIEEGLDAPISKASRSCWDDKTAFWHGQYFDNTSLKGMPVFTREDFEIDFNWGMGPPGPRIDADSFSVQWRRLADLSPGMYRFTVASTNGVRFRIDGRIVLSAWYEHKALTLSRVVQLAGGPVDLAVEYYSTGPVAMVRLVCEYWT